MNLSHATTSPSVRSCLYFTEQEAIDALKEYAVKQGYALNGKAFIFYPHASDRDEGLKLLVDGEGSTEPTITERKPQ